MTAFYEKIKKNWYWYLVAAILFCEAGVFLFCGDNSYIAIHDNLDLFVAHFKILSLNHAFFAQNTQLPMLGGVSRDTLGSEWSLYNILYFLLPSFWAYMTGYLIKIIIGFLSFLLLAKDIYGKNYIKYRPIAVITGFAFAIIPVFPAYSISFASIPLAVLILRKLYKDPKKVWYVALFLYPLISYFSYFGFFILAYLVCGLIILWIRDRKLSLSLLLSVPVLSLGYVCFEYRLFREMLFGDVVTIRSTMLNADSTISQVMTSVWSVFREGIFHAQASHMYIVLPVCLVFFFCINIRYLQKREWKALRLDSFNLVMGLIVFNCLIYGLYDLKAFRDLFETLLPPLKGFQFSRTVFFNPFLWYAALFLCLKRLYDNQKPIFKKVANLIAVFAMLAVLLAPAVYNDFYYTCYYNAYKIIKQKEVSNLNFREFYSEDLFQEIKEDIGYNGEESVAYGMHPAVLQYNGISTLDGYLGFYSVEYKEKFRKIIAPALDQSEEFQTYFDDWGARAYIFSGAGENTYQPLKKLDLKDQNLYIDTKAFKELKGTYIFSRVELANAEELGLTLVKQYSEKTSPYIIYLYQI